MVKVSRVELPVIQLKKIIIKLLPGKHILENVEDLHSI